MATGAADATVAVWEDCTAADEEEAAAEEAAIVLKQQDLSNALQVCLQCLCLPINSLSISRSREPIPPSIYCDVYPCDYRRSSSDRLMRGVLCDCRARTMQPQQRWPLRCGSQGGCSPWWMLSSAQAATAAPQDRPPVQQCLKRWQPAGTSGSCVLSRLRCWKGR